MKRLEGTGPVVNDLEWCAKSYLAMAGAMHDAAVSAWGCKGWYDYLRPVSALRYLADLGQCTDTQQASYHPDGINLHPGFVEVVSPTTTAPGQRHEHLAGSEGKIAVRAWRGPEFIQDPAVDTAGVGWILAENWWPYQRPTFVTPPFAGYVSGHSTFSRAAAVIMDRLTGSPYFPDGLGEFVCEQDEFLVFEEGPSVTIRLQWASYYDASDQCSLSRIWGGIHPAGDDLPGRQMGQAIGTDAFVLAQRYWAGSACDATLASTELGLGQQWRARCMRAAGHNRTARLNQPNSTGVPGRMVVLGSDAAASNDLQLGCALPPPWRVWVLPKQPHPSTLAQLPGSQGDRCLIALIGSYANQIQQSSPEGTFLIDVDLSATPTPTGNGTDPGR